VPRRTSQTFSATLGLGPSCFTMKLLISLLSYSTGVQISHSRGTVGTFCRM
jgi:hypothetical protein